MIFLLLSRFNDLRAEKYIRLQVNCPYYLSGFNQSVDCSQMTINIFRTKFQISKLLNFIQIIARGRETDRNIWRRLGGYFSECSVACVRSES